MSLLTPFLKLFKWDTTNETDLESEFNIDKSMNENWDKLDKKAQEYENKILDIQDDIEENTTKNTQQDELIQKLQSNTIQESTEEATSLHVEDASDLPARLNVVGNHYQEVQEGTDNLAVLQEGSITQNGMTINIKNGVATMSGSNTSDTTNYVIVGTAYLYAGQTYYMKAERNQTSGSSGLSIKLGSSIKWFTVGQEIAFECTQTGEYEVRVSFGVSAATNSGTFKLLISKTSGVAWKQGKRAIPSLEYPSETLTVKDNIKIIQCNSNFLKKQKEAETTGQGLTGKVLADGTITLNGTTTGTTYIQITDELKILDFAGSKNLQKHVLAKGKYIFSVEKTGQTNNNNVHVYLRTSSSGKQNFNISITKISESDKKETKFEMSDRKDYVAYIYIPENITFTDFTMKFMLKREDDNSEYIQNEQKEYNLAVQQEMLKNDKFDLLNNKEVHVWKKLILNGTENWQQSSVYNNVFYLVINDMMTDINKAELISNQYKYEGYITDTAEIQNNKCYTYKQYQFTNNKAVYVRNDNFTTLESFKASLAEKNMTLYYVSDTTTELDLTEEQKETLNQLNNLELFKGINNIYTKQDLALLQLNYTADTKMYIDNKINSIAGGN